MDGIQTVDCNSILIDRKFIYRSYQVTCNVTSYSHSDNILAVSAVVYSGLQNSMSELHIRPGSIIFGSIGVYALLIFNSFF